MTGKIDWSLEKKQQAARRRGVNTGGIQTWSQPDIQDHRTNKDEEPDFVEVSLLAGKGDKYSSVVYHMSYTPSKSAARYLTEAAGLLDEEFEGAYGFTPEYVAICN